MILRMTAACNNHCFFCIVDDEIASTQFRPTEELLARVDDAGPNETIDIFGGEPTIDPSFWPVVRHILASGRRMTLASNVRAFAKRSLAERLMELGGDKVIVRTTLMAADADLHDRLNVARGAFVQTAAGIRNLAALGCDVRVNMVLLADNLASITDTALLAFESGATSFKMSGAVRTDKFRGALANPEDLRRAIGMSARVLALLELPFKFEKLPFCLAGDGAEHAWRVQAEEAEVLGLNDRWFRPMTSCRGCALATACPGGELGMVERFGEDWARPLATPPRDWTIEVGWRELTSASLPPRVRFVRVAKDDLPIERFSEFGASVVDFWRRHPGVSVI